MPNSINSLAQKYSINTAKPFFPVNTMRLLYLLIADGLTKGNQEVTDKVNSIIPKISATFDNRDQFLRDNKETNPLLEIQACRQAIDDIFAIVNTPVVHHTFDLLFSDLYPLQENLLVSLDRHLSEEKLNPSDLNSILKIRAMDSVVYSSIIYQIIHTSTGSKPEDTLSATNYSTSPIHWQINTTLQINDIADAVIHAKEDLDAGAATIIDVAKRIGGEPQKTVDILNQSLDKLLAQSQKLPFPQPLQQTINDFNKQLIACVHTAPQSDKQNSKPSLQEVVTNNQLEPTSPNPQEIPAPPTPPINQDKIISDEADPEAEEIASTQPPEPSQEQQLPEPNPETPPPSDGPQPLPQTQTPTPIPASDTPAPTE